MKDPLRHHNYDHLLGAFASDDFFGAQAERFARFFGTPKFIVGQTIMIIVWITLNVTAFVAHWDAYPFILLNLAFSTQAAYAAPLILLAQNRQADREKEIAIANAKHVQEEADIHNRMLDEIHKAVCTNADSDSRDSECEAAEAQNASHAEPRESALAETDPLHALKIHPQSASRL